MRKGGIPVAEKKYYVSYTSGPTGYGWEREYDRLDEFEDFIRGISRTAYIFVYDNELGETIYRKDILDDKPTIDLLSAPLRDFRYKTRTYKNYR